jgi:acyl carrier protein
VCVRLTIISEIEKVAAEQSKKVAALDNSLVLAESGLDSLCFAILVARLEDELVSDPFTAADDVAFPVTLGDFIELYENDAR